MVGQISVFPDVGGAFFGSYRQARGQRLQEAAMRAEMAAAQADRQRQAQARASFAALTAPDRVEQVQLDPFQRTTNRLGGLLGNAGVEGANMRYAEERSVPHLTQNQRATEMQALAQSDPNLFAAFGEMQAGPEARDYSDIYQIQANRVASGNTTVEDAARIVAGIGGDPRAHAAEIAARVQQQEADQVNGTIIQTEQGQFLINPRTGAVIEEYGGRPTQSRGPLVRVEGDRPDRGLPVGTPLTGAYLNDYFGGQAYPEDGLYTADVRNARGDQPIQQYQEPDPEDTDAPGSASDIYADVASIEAQRALDLVFENPDQITGYAGVIRAFADPTSQAGQLRGTLETLTSQAAFDRLAALRADSPTGGAVGQVSDREQQMLRASLGDISQITDASILAERLERYRAVMRANADGIIYENDTVRLAREGDDPAQIRRPRNVSEAIEATGYNPASARERVNQSRGVSGELSPAARGWLENTPLRNGQ